MTDISIIGGLGHIGLPFGLVLADAGYEVMLYDTDEKKQALVTQGRMPFMEHGADELLARWLHKRVHVVQRLATAADAQHVVIAVGTPLDEHQNPSLLPILQLGDAMVPYLKPRTHVMLRSTVYPGTTAKLAQALGPNVDVSFCPERIVQGRAIRELRTLPQIISGAVGRARTFFEPLQVELIEVGTREAELSKLYCNTWRYLQFAAANQLYSMAFDLGADFQQIHHAVTWHYARMSAFPRPGFAAGPCLLKDTLQLVSAAQGRFSLGQAAVAVNEGLPAVIVQRLATRVPLDGLNVAVLGMAFKADIDDPRDSLAFKLRRLLEFQGARTYCSDEYMQRADLLPRDAAIERAQAVIIGVPHSAYRGLVLSDDKLVVDLWGVTKGGQR